MSTITVSIILCTRNRADSLIPTLESIGKVTVPKEWKVELLVVDNGSTDQTSAAVGGARLSNVTLRYVNEPRPGQCHARNTGLRETTGEIILFTDDDIRVPTDWVEAMCKPILGKGADAVAGGVLFPPHIASVLTPPPFSSLRNWFASTEGLDPDQPARMVGANMAFHRRALQLVPEFDVELGPGALGFGDETLFSRQLLAAGCKLVSALDVAVEHHFDSSRLTGEGLLDLARKMGRTHAFVFHHWDHKRLRLAHPRLILSGLKLHWARFSDWLTGSGNFGVSLSTIEAEQDYSFYCGYLIQRQRRRKYSLHGLVPLDLPPEASLPNPSSASRNSP